MRFVTQRDEDPRSGFDGANNVSGEGARFSVSPQGRAMGSPIPLAAPFKKNGTRTKFDEARSAEKGGAAAPA